MGPAPEAIPRCKLVSRLPPGGPTYLFENLSNFTLLGTHFSANGVGGIVSPGKIS